jgi:hypothetical protein
MRYMNKCCLYLIVFLSEQSFACGPNLPSSFLADAISSQPVPFALSRQVRTAIEEGKKTFPFHIKENDPKSIHEERLEADHWELAESLAKSNINLHDGVPEEFQLYRMGVQDMGLIGGPEETSENGWKKLLMLAPDRRRYRTTWALYMLGNIQADHREAKKYYDSLRHAVLGGYHDSLHLAATSFKKESLKVGISSLNSFIALSKMYLAGFHYGDAEIKDLQGLAWVILNDPKTLDEESLSLLIQPEVLGVLNAIILDDLGHREVSRQSLAAKFYQRLDQREVFSVTNAEILAWGAYTVGEYDLAQKWLGLADVKKYLTLMLKSRLAARNGDLDGSLKIAGAALHAYRQQMNFDPLTMDQFPARDFDWVPTAPAELGFFMGQTATMALNMKKTDLAFKFFLAGRHWLDAAYLAEQILTTKQLQALTKEAYTVATINKKKSGIQTVWLKHLLARRLMREEKFDDAIVLFKNKPSANDAHDFVQIEYDLKNLATQYKTKIKLSKKTGISADEKAANLFAAATLKRKYGLELFGTDVEPDWAIFDGQYDPTPIHSSQPNQKRLTFQHCDDRFHYRYEAVDLAQQAAKSSSYTEFSCKVLGTAGNWIKDRNAEVGKGIYKVASKICLSDKPSKAAFFASWDNRSARSKNDTK